ncbi:class I SAM-dependent methyltransferase [Candidatus Gracilibacteria bacterium]|nr:class I SAM-dependent methyltransferase [Candidatus Gracilibacteria bacterium]
MGEYSSEGYSQAIYVVREFLKNTGTSILPDVKQDRYADLGRLRQLKILDIGCGNPSSIATWAPWLCRVLGTWGVDITGVDIEEQKPGEPFRSVRADLSQIGILKDIFPEDHQFDVINSNCFIGWNPPPELEPQQIADMRLEITKQVHRLLKSNGIYCYDRYPHSGTIYSPLPSPTNSPSCD